MPINVPQRYIPKYLTQKQKEKARKELKKSRQKYKKGEYYTRAKVANLKAKKSQHILKAERMYKLNNLSLNAELAKKTQCSLPTLKKIFQKGQGAYYSSGSRPNQTLHSWAYSRLASGITGGKASAVDYKLLQSGCKSSSKALRLAKKAYIRYKKGTRRVPKVRL